MTGFCKPSWNASLSDTLDLLEPETLVMQMLLRVFGGTYGNGCRNW